jgi:hypothetical protein
MRLALEIEIEVARAIDAAPWWTFIVEGFVVTSESPYNIFGENRHTKPTSIQYFEDDYIT